MVSDFNVSEANEGKVESWQGKFGWCGAGAEAPASYEGTIRVYDNGAYSCVGEFEMWLASLYWSLAIITGGSAEPTSYAVPVPALHRCVTLTCTCPRRRCGSGPYPQNDVWVLNDDGELRLRYADAEPMQYLAVESIVLILVVLLMAALWAYVTAKFVDVIANSNPDAAHFRNQIDDLNRFCSFHQLPTALRQELREYAHERKEVLLAEQRKRVFNDLSDELQEDVAWTLNGHWLLRIPVLAKLKNRRFLVKVALAMTSAVYAPRERPTAQRLYVIIRGHATYLGRTLKPGEHWGQSDMAKTKRPARATALTYLHVNFVATQTILELAEKAGNKVLWELKKYVIFQHMREYMLFQLRKERKKKAWRETRGDQEMPPDDTGKDADHVAPVTLEKRVETMAEEMKYVKKTIEAMAAHNMAILNSMARQSGIQEPPVQSWATNFEQVTRDYEAYKNEEARLRKREDNAPGARQLPGDNVVGTPPQPEPLAPSCAPAALVPARPAPVAVPSHGPSASLLPPVHPAKAPRATKTVTIQVPQPRVAGPFQVMPIAQPVAPMMPLPRATQTTRATGPNGQSYTQGAPPAAQEPRR